MSSSHHPVAPSVRAYSRVLAQAGGQLVDATTPRAPDDLRVALYESPPYRLRIDGIDVPRLSINLRPAPVRGGLAGDPERDFGGRRYSMFLTPAGAGVVWSKSCPSRHLNIYFHPAVVAEAVDGAQASLSIDEPLFDAHLPRVRSWVDALELAIGRDEACAQDAALSLARVILAALAQRPATPAPTLSPAAVALIRDYVIAHIDRPQRVAELAAVVRMSPSRFAFAFVATTGCTPHRYVLQQRLLRAREMLRVSSADLAQVAAACGFSSQQHLTTTMRRLQGTTPGSLRRRASELIVP